MRNDANVLDRLITGEQVEATPEVRELAQLATILQGAWQAGPTKAATNRTRAAVLSAFVENGNGNGAAAVATPIAAARVSRGRRVLARVALAAALVLTLPAAAWAASEDALPGQLMYPVKRGFEEVRVALAGDPVDEARVLLDLMGERVEEVILAASLDLGPTAQQAREGFDELVARFQGRIAEAEALGLSVEQVTAEAAAAYASYQEIFNAIFGAPPAAPAPQPTEVLSAAVPEEEQQVVESGNGKAEAKSKKGDGKRDNRPKAQRGGNKAGGAGAAGSGGSAGGSDGQTGDSSGGGGGGNGGNGGGGGGNGGNGGAGGAGGGEDAEQEDPPESDGDDDADDGEEDDDEDDEHSGSGLGHEKAIGEGHDADNGEGHEGDD